jgi:uncharacterized membrane protein
MAIHDAPSPVVENVSGKIEPSDARAPFALSRRVTIESASFSGPLPTPSILAEYDDVVPGLAREIVDQWKAETRHRHETVTSIRGTDHEAMLNYYEAERRGQTFSMVAILGVLAVAIVAIAFDRPAVGVASLLTGAAATIWAMRRRSGGPDLPAPIQLDADEEGR